MVQRAQGERGQKSCLWEAGQSRLETKAQEECLGCGTPPHLPATVQRGTRQEVLQVVGAPWGSGVRGTWVSPSAGALCPLTPHHRSCVASPCGSLGATSRTARHTSSRSMVSPLWPETQSWLWRGRSLGVPSRAAGEPDLQGPEWRRGKKKSLTQADNLPEQDTK